VKLFVRSLFFTVLIPGTVTVVLPYFMVTRGAGPPPRLQWAAILPIVLGASTLLRCIWDFAVAGRGTLAPVSPPKRLVVCGLYRFVRNPMYVGVITTILGEAWLFLSVPLLVHAVITFLIVHTFVVLYEEPTLRRMFGSSYAEYCRSVNRWLPKVPRAAGPERAQRPSTD
jgi:protein-S-isoprenylcysteine O-methyltransferase Ste14